MTKYCMKFIINFSHDRKQTLHGLLDWNTSMTVDVPNSTFLRLKTEEGKVVGQIAIELDSNAWIFCFGIDPSCREMGLGTTLLERAEKYILDHGYEKVYLHVQKEHEKMLFPFYEKRGYKKIHKDNYIDEWVMKKTLV